MDAWETVIWYRIDSLYKPSFQLVDMDRFELDRIRELGKDAPKAIDDVAEIVLRNTKDVVLFLRRAKKITPPEEYEIFYKIVISTIILHTTSNMDEAFLMLDAVRKNLEQMDVKIYSGK